MWQTFPKSKKSSLHILNTSVCYIQGHSTQGRSRSFYQDPEPRVPDPYERSRSVPPKEQLMTGLAIGHAETASAAKRRKDQYRQELEQQISTHRNAPRYVCFSTVVHLSTSCSSSSS